MGDMRSKWWSETRGATGWADSRPDASPWMSNCKIPTTTQDVVSAAAAAYMHWVNFELKTHLWYNYLRMIQWWHTGRKQSDFGSKFGRRFGNFFFCRVKAMNFCAHSYLMESRLFGEENSNLCHTCMHSIITPKQVWVSAKITLRKWLMSEFVTKSQLLNIFQRV
jgi:hypothetical protein